MDNRQLPTLSLLLPHHQSVSKRCRRMRTKILLNFMNVEFLSSAALGKLITLDKKLKAAKGQLKLSSIRPEIYEVFAITRLNKLFDIHDDEADALATF